MSWATEDWTAGLSGLVLQKVRELQAHNEKLNRERQQRQLQLDNSEAALHKQKQKYEEVRVELAAVQRELVGVREGAQAEARAKERLAQELQVKATQVCSVENQLQSARALAQKLAQEVKRLEAELEKLQKESVSGESLLFSTPSWNMNSPWDQSVSKNSLRGEEDSKAHHVRQQLMFADSPKPSQGGVSSQFPQQPHKTPSHRRGLHQSETRTPSSVFPWERDDTMSNPRGRPASTPSFSSSEVIVTGSDSQDNEVEEALRKERDALSGRVSGLQRELQAEKERYRDTESCLAQTQKELNIKEQSLTRSKDELARAQTRITQEGDRAQGAEQRVKHLQEELKCQRQNAETTRCNAEQRKKEMEREHQKELLELQRERQSMEKQHQQENNRLNQEIQQARTAHNTLQSQYDKLALQKQAVEQDLEGVQAKLKSTQADLTESQKRESQTQAKLTESQRESETLSVSLEQLKKKEKTLEAEVKRLTEELAEALKLIKELQAKLAAPPPPPPLVSHSFTPVCGDSFTTPVLSSHLDRSPPHQVSAQKKRGPKPARPREIDRPVALPYPPDREPAEGIESEHISEFGSEDSVTLSTKEHEGNQHRATRPGDLDMESSITEQDTGIEDTDTDSYMSDSTSERMFKDEGFSQADIRCDSRGKDSISLHQGQKQDSSSLKELKKENTALRDELRDTKQELERRLDDLETQRRAEAEARTKLKQLSKKHSSQTEQHRAKAQEFKEKGSKLEAQLEQERKESVRLKEMVARLEKESEKRQEAREKEEEESKEEKLKLQEALAEMERKEEELQEEREKIQTELDMLKQELKQEREERAREREEEEKKRLKTNELDGLKIAELQAELDRLQRSAGLKDSKSLNDNMPLTYLQLGNQSNTTDDSTAFENKVISPFDASISFLESANLQNTMFSKETIIASLIKDCGIRTKCTEHYEKNTEESILQGDVTKKEGHEKSSEDKDLDNTTVLVLEVERLRMQRDREAERAKKSQKKLEVLQNQVTSQTQQLTQAFEHQSKHIENLLKELQERDAALQRQEEELQSCRDEIASLKADKQGEEMVNRSATSNNEQSTEAAEETSCGLVISDANVDREEALQDLKEKASITMDDIPLQSDIDKSDQNQVSSVISTLEHSSLPTSNGQVSDSAAHTENTKAKEPQQPLEPQEPHTTVQQDGGHVDENNTASTEIPNVSNPDMSTKQSDISEFPQRLIAYPKNDVSELKRVVNELHETQNELSLLKAKHDQLSLQLLEVSKEDFLLIKKENEQLKSKLTLMSKELQASQKPLLSPAGISNLKNIKEEDPAVVNQAIHCSGTSSRREEAEGVGGNSADGEEGCRNKGEEADTESKDEAYSSVQVISLQKRVQALHTQLQLISEQNSRQAEELELWRLSTSSLGENMDDHSNGSPIVLVREDQLILSCSPCGHHGQNQQTRNAGQCGDLSQPEDFSGPQIEYEEGDDQLLAKTTKGHFQSVIKVKDYVVIDDCTITESTDEPKMNNTVVDVNGTSQVSSSETEISEDTRHDLAHPVKSREPCEDASESVMVCPENQSMEDTFRRENQENHSATGKSELITEPQDLRDNQLPCLNFNESVTFAEHTGAPESTSDQQIEHDSALGSLTDNSALMEDDVMKHFAAHQGQRSETTTVSGHTVTKEVKSVSTQTEECEEREVEDIRRSLALQEKKTLLHVCTQTEEMKQSEEEEGQDDELTTSPPSSPAPPSEPEKLMFSSAFPIPADPAHLAERIRRNRSRMSAAYDDTEYEPYGLPEVVMKGFADIPSGPACPYVLRRGLLGTDALPRSLREPLKEEEDVDP
ncbi:centromere protein F [Astyanax mexicanus]|uniref:centromere protein F n=1 Tax=Astyanax mexicanus TaxID=7994 RepID=UPI0020CABC7B|nr:centromere protein F [Astyanax mexicanus]XP_022539277.2 centromere protein F [Astyanax mexicanus]